MLSSVLGRCRLRHRQRHRGEGAAAPDVGTNVGIERAKEAPINPGSGKVQEDLLEAATGVEPVIKVLQT